MVTQELTPQQRELCQKSVDSVHDKAAELLEWIVGSYGFCITQPSQKRQTFTAQELADAIRKVYDLSTPRNAVAVYFLELKPALRITVTNY